MGYRIIYRDMTIEVDTLIEFQNALNFLRTLEIKHKTHAVPDETPERPLLPTEPTDRLTTANKMVNFYRSLLPGDTHNLVNALYEKPDGLTSQELQNILNITPGGLGGSLGGVTKAAKAYRLHGDDIVSKPKEFGGRYQLTPSIREVIRGELEKNLKR